MKVYVCARVWLHAFVHVFVSQSFITIYNPDGCKLAHVPDQTGL